MILPSPELLLAIGAALVALWCAVTVAACRAYSARTAKELEAALENCRREYRESIDKALREFTPATPEAPVTEPIRDPGRLNRSARTRALKLLRSGVAPDSAAATLEIPRKDVVLISRVGAILAP